MEVLRLSLRRYRFFPEFGARLPINSSAGLRNGGVRPAVPSACLFGVRRVFRTGRVRAPRVRPSFADYGIFVGRLYASMYQISRIRSFHIRQPRLAVYPTGPYHEVLFVKRFHAEKPETRKPLRKVYDRASLYRSLPPCILTGDARADRSVPA